MDVYYACDDCETELHYTTDGEDQPADTCPECGASFDLHPDFQQNNELEHCLVCSGTDFYESQQINPNFGFSMIVLGSLGFLGSIFFIPGMNGFLWGMVVLLSLAVIDRVLRLALPEAVICYQCSSVYHSLNNDEDFGEFDHELATELKFSEE